jgi:hypothetical protein
MVHSNAWKSSISRHVLTSSSKTSFAIRFAGTRTSVILTGQSARLFHMMPGATLTRIARSNVGTLTAIATAIALAMMNIKWQSALVSSAPAIATGRMTVVTINLKS